MSMPPSQQLQSRTPESAALRTLFEKQKDALRSGALDYKKRREALQLLETAVLDRQSEFVRAADEDFGGRARQETLALELAPVVDSIRHAKRNLARWMKPQKVRTGINFFPASAKIIYQPLGVVGIIGAWNYPSYLTLAPLVDAIAAGNRVLVKPSELAPATAELLRQMISAIFPSVYVAVATGDAQF